jgi:hypothetical protein
VSNNDLGALDARPKRGRRRAENGLGTPISTRLTEAERQAFVEKVRASGLSQSEFLRQCVLTNRTQIVARPPVSADYKRIVFVINKTGNNLNQLAHVANHANAAGQLRDDLFVALLDELELITQLLKAHLHRVD